MYRQADECFLVTWPCFSQLLQQSQSVSRALRTGNLRGHEVITRKVEQAAVQMPG